MDQTGTFTLVSIPRGRQVVTPGSPAASKDAGQCEHYPSCNCWRARQSQRCQSCHKYIYEGHCILKGMAGWVHVRCPGEHPNRGLPMIQQSFLPTKGGSLIEETPRTRRRLLFDEEDSRPQSDASTSRKKSKSEIVPASESSGLSEEQVAIRDFPAQKGDIICVNALAGCGKTTTIALLCDKYVQANPPSSVLYLVYAKKNQDEAMASQKFPKNGMEIRTTHAFVLRYYFGPGNNNVNPIPHHKLEDLISLLKLTRCVNHRLPNTQPNKLDRIVHTIAGSIRRTLNAFQASSDRSVAPHHVPIRIRKRDYHNRVRNAWRKMIHTGDYVNWAQQYFDAIQQRCNRVRDGTEIGNGITHDAYIKVAQLERLAMDYDYDMVAIDEAQDMTPCQADLFWSSDKRRDKVVYLFGDRYQQLYRFRGARECFALALPKSEATLSLTGSFRFGERIASVATDILVHMGYTERLQGRSREEGSVYDATHFRGGVVLCRTNNGMFRYLLSHGPTRWCFLDKGMRLPQRVDNWILRLEEFLWFMDEGKAKNEDEGTEKDRSGVREDDHIEDGRVATTSFQYKGEVFTSVDDVKEYIQDEDDAELSRQLHLILMLKDDGKHVQEFYAQVRTSFCPLGMNEQVDCYEGVVLSTTHTAKGFEFARVLIWDDFRFSVIVDCASSLTGKRVSDEANVLYVAISRVKRELFLTESAKKCLEKLSRTSGQSPVRASAAEFEERRRKWTERWTKFEQDDSPIVSSAGIPWPEDTAGGNNPFDLHPEMDEETQKSLLRNMKLRFHTDKFLPKHRDRLNEIEQREMEVILSRLNDLFRRARQSIQNLMNEDVVLRSV